MLTTSRPQKSLEFNTVELARPLETQASWRDLRFELGEVSERMCATPETFPSKMLWEPAQVSAWYDNPADIRGKFENGKRIDGLTSLGQFTGVKGQHAGRRLVGDAVETTRAASAC